ncbi:MAG TPA: hypothetical protein VFO60_05450 [Candidatus Dormibacteraeota bacterium]|nr:hypothetical protein [Candidatus Dormibacteraeota bacterium]
MAGRGRRIAAVIAVATLSVLLGAVVSRATVLADRHADTASGAPSRGAGADGLRPHAAGRPVESREDADESGAGRTVSAVHSAPRAAVAGTAVRHVTLRVGAVRAASPPPASAPPAARIPGAPAVASPLGGPPAIGPPADAPAGAPAGAPISIPAGVASASATPALEAAGVVAVCLLAGLLLLRVLATR